MPRANRIFAQHGVWHINHRCHKKEFLLKFVRDRRLWRYWLFEARRRYGLSVLNYIVIDHERLVALTEAGSLAKFQRNHRNWIGEKLRIGQLQRDDRWTRVDVADANA